MEDKCEFGKTSKVKDTVYFKKFKYYKHKENQNHSVRWRCREYQRKKSVRQALPEKLQSLPGDRDKNDPQFPKTLYL